MDLFKINCPHCGQPLEVPAAMARDTVACPTCNGVLELAKLIPQPIAESMCSQGSGAPQGGGRQRKAKKTGWWIALACMAGLVAVAAIVFFVLPKNNGGESESKSSEPVAAMDQEEREAEARATYELGMEYLEGKKQEQDYDKACELLEKAFELGSQEAIEKLVEIYYYGSHGRRDFDKAMEYAQLGIEKYSNEFCWQTKGLMLLDKGDDEEAYGCFEKAQHYYCSLFSVACMKYSGMGTEIDHRGAVVYFLQASKNKFHRPVKGENYGSDILLEGLLLYFNPDMWQIGRSRGYNVNNL